MNIYITFYMETCPGSNIIRINNGFSFGRDKTPDDIDLILNVANPGITNLIQESIAKHNPDKIFVTITYNYEATLIFNIVDERWVIGGPLVYWSKNDNTTDDWINFFPSGPTYVYTSMEEYLGKTELSSDFDPYFIDHFSKNHNDCIIHYNMCISLRYCYWKKCTFCTYHGLGKDKTFERQNIEKIINDCIAFKDIGGNIYRAHTCTPSLTSGQLKRISNANKPKHALITSFIRPDEGMLNAVRQVDDLTGHEFIVGAEGFAQGIVDELGKGFKISTMLEFTDEILKRNGGVIYTLMFGYTFLTKEIVDEYRDTIKKIEDIIIKNNKVGKDCVGVNIEPQIIWQDKYNAEKFGFPSVRVTHPWSKGIYLSKVPKDHIQHIYNDEMYNCIKQSKMIPHW